MLDPWNGIGTTTLVASRVGIESYGFDINPALSMVARSLLIDSLDPGSIHRQVKDLVVAAHKAEIIEKEDMLATWFHRQSCAVIRSIEHSVRRRLVPVLAGSSRFATSSASYEVAFFYLALFRTVRQLLRKFSSSNPTWIKEPKRKEQRLRPSATTIVRTFESVVRELLERDDKSDNLGRLVHPKSVRLGISPSWDIPLPASCIDAVIASPPYCTRIDYAVATKPELAVLGYTSEQFKELRKLMIGSPTISGEEIEPIPSWGRACNSFLDSVKSHDSQASRSYYLKTYLQYFDGIFRSIAEIDRVLKPSRYCVLVVQDSYYKDIHVNISPMIMEMASAFGWSTAFVQDYVNSKSFAGVNSRSRKYRPMCLPTESVIALRK